VDGKRSTGPMRSGWIVTSVVYGVGHGDFKPQVQIKLG
jgi:hypothetical protein